MILKGKAKKRFVPEDEHGLEPQSKHQALKSCQLMQRYPVKLKVCADNTRSIERHMQAMKDELSKARPRDTILLPLMKSTYYTRRTSIQIKSVVDILEEYKALSRQSVMYNAS